MADRSKIEWTDASWNPIRARNLKTGKVGWHCEHATTGCEFCYSEGFNKRLGTGLPYKPGHRKDIEIFLDEQMLTQPLRWKKPRKIFVCSMTDAFADFVTDEMLDKMFGVMALAPQHTFQVLTKRAKRMRAYFDRYRGGDDHNCADMVADAAAVLLGKSGARGADRYNGKSPGWPLANVWLGVSAERQQEADERIPELLATPAAVRFVSLEPLLDYVDLDTAWHGEEALNAECWGDCAWCKNGHPPLHNCQRNRPSHFEDRSGLDWVIAGGESGAHARPMNPDWARQLRDQCKRADVPFFFKQWGEFRPAADGEDLAVSGTCLVDDQRVRRVGKAKAGRLLDGFEHNEFPRVPA